MTETVSAPRRGRPRKSLFAPKPAETERSFDEAMIDAAPRASRPALRDESPRERAARRAAEIRGHNNGDMDDGSDEFYIDPATIPEGWSYEWKTKSVLGKEDPAYETSLRRKGWEPVDSARHPELMPRGSVDTEITRKGMVLMERPLELTEEARAIEQRRARLQVQTKQEQLGAAKPGEFERSNKDAPLVRVKKTYEKIPIPD